VRGELVRAWTKDELQLQGLYCWSGAASKLPAVVHIHGASSNFYRSQFLDRLADALTERGFPFLTANTRGHDIINSVYSADPTAGKHIGVAFERFDDCVLDIAAWMKLLEDLGSAGAVLMGHSFGANKVSFYESETSDPRVKGLIFLSPADQGYWVEALGPQMEQALSWAREKVAAGEGRTLLSGGLAPYPISAQTMLSTFFYAKSDIFKFGRPDDPWEVVSALGRPILAVMGTVGEFLNPTPAEALDLLKAKATRSPRCETVVLDGAPHNYRGYEEELSTAILDWLTDAWCT
jgi:pimeloyl-ACP methyl ester carboxylesterase